MNATVQNHLNSAFNAVLMRLPDDAKRALSSLWGGPDGKGDVLLCIVDGLECLGCCSEDGKRICVRQDVTNWPSRGLQTLFAHEVAHAYQVATGQISDKAAMERQVYELIQQWGYVDEEIEFWQAYANADKASRKRMKDALMRKDQTLMKQLQEFRAEKMADPFAA